MVALGNRLRQDDAVGPVVLDHLAGCELPRELSLTWLEHHPSGLSLLDPALSALMIIDALRMDLPPGSIVALPLLELSYQAPQNLHQLSPLDLLPEELHERTQILGIVPAILGYGLELSPAVARAAVRAVEHLQAWVWDACRANERTVSWSMTYDQNRKV